MGKAKRIKRERLEKDRGKRPLRKRDLRKTYYYIIFLVLFLVSALLWVKFSKRDVIGADDGSDPARGASDSKVTIVEFSDFQCPACGVMHPVLAEMVKRYPDEVKIVYKNYPLVSVHKWAYTAALAGECAFEEGKFWELHDLLFSRQRIWSQALDPREDFLSYAEELGMDRSGFNTCIDSSAIRKRVEEDRKEGRKLNINSTPTFFINNKRYVGVWKVQEFDRIIRKVLERR